MKMSSKARYGLYAAVELAKRYDTCEVVPVCTLAQCTGVTEKYLEQILALMKKQNVVVAVRGANGGYKLKNPPQSLKELVESDQNWRVIYQDPRTSTPGLGLLLWMQKVYGDDAPQAWQKLAKKTVTVTKGWSEAYGLFLKGESDLVLSYTTSPAYHILEEKKDNYAAANFSEGHYLQVEVAARTAASKQPELAQKFLQFMVSPAFQNAIPTGNWMYPVANVTLPAGFEQLTKPATTLEFTPAEVAAQRQAWISEWQRAVSR